MTACGSGSSPKGWTTPQAHDARGKGDPKRWRRFGGKHGGANLPDEVAMVQTAPMKPWATPQARDGTPRGAQAKRFLNPDRSNDLPDEVAMVLSPWPTPRVCSGERSSGLNRTDMYRAGPANQPTPWPTVAPWSTPTENDSTNLGAPSQFSRNSQALNVQAKANWSTPRATDGAKGSPNQAFGAGGQPLPAQAAQTVIHGAMPPGSNAPTESSGALNPAWVCWLMGYPNGWLD
jgi:hypothetical protein